MRSPENKNLPVISLAPSRRELLDEFVSNPSLATASGIIRSFLEKEPIGDPLEDIDLALFSGLNERNSAEKRWYSEIGQIISEGRQRLFARRNYWELRGLQFEPRTDEYDAYRLILNITLGETIQQVRSLAPRLNSESIDYESAAAVTHPSGSIETLPDGVIEDPDAPEIEQIERELGLFSQKQIQEALDQETFLYAKVFDKETGEIRKGCLTACADKIMLFFLPENSPLVMRMVLSPEDVLEFRLLSQAERNAMEEGKAQFFTALEFADLKESMMNAPRNPNDEYSGMIRLWGNSYGIPS